MSFKKLAMGIAIASTVCLAGSKLALASGSAKAIRSCTQSETGHDPSSMQVFLYSGTGRNGSCWVLELPTIFFSNTWGGYDTVGEGFPNDVVTYVQVGSGVRIKLFWNTFNAHDEGAYMTLAYIGPNSYWNLGTWARGASAARVEWTGLPANCAATYNYLSIWDTAGSPVGGGDCTMLSTFTGRNVLSGPVQMAFRNDNLSAFASGPAVRSFTLFNNVNYGSYLTSTFQMTCGNVANLPACGIYNYGTPNADNKTSSID